MGRAKHTKPKLNEVKNINFDPKTQKSISFSQFQLYSQCQHKWAQQYIYKNLQTPPSIHLIFGTAVHEIFQEYLTVGFESSFADADRIDMGDRLKSKLREQYLASYEKNNNLHFSNAGELDEFYQDGLAIINWFKKRRGEYFTNRKHLLIGTELPLYKNLRSNIIYRGYIDLVVYDEKFDEITIYDIKTSTKGWSDWDKKNDNKLAQLLFYKQYFSELYGFPMDRIKIEFFILKRKIKTNEYVEFPKRIQIFKPTDGKIKMKQALDKLDNFINNVFDEQGEYIYKDYPKNITKLCGWCPINNTPFCIK